MYKVKLTPKPVELEAILWTGYNFASVYTWYLQHGGVTEAMSGNDGKTLRVHNKLEDQWTYIPQGHYLICGLEGEFYPFEATACHKKYNVEEIEDADN